jgi:hypothetical protein
MSPGQHEPAAGIGTGRHTACDRVPHAEHLAGLTCGLGQLDDVALCHVAPRLGGDHSGGNHAQLQAGFDRAVERGAEHGGFAERLQQLVVRRNESAAAACGQHDDGG